MSAETSQTFNYTLSEPVSGVYEAVCKLNNQWTGGITISDVICTINSPEGAMWNINLSIDCNNMNNTKSNIETGTDVSWKNVHTNLTKDTSATLTLTCTSPTPPVTATGTCTIEVNI